ncbi:hypothetical protein Trydic_g6223 [Trypoxylus dichotomus]
MAYTTHELYNMIYIYDETDESVLQTCRRQRFPNRRAPSRGCERPSRVLRTEEVLLDLIERNPGRIQKLTENGRPCVLYSAHRTWPPGSPDLIYLTYLFIAVERLKT